MKLKQIAAGLAAALFLAGSASALENTVKPEVTAPLAKSPKVALLVGNSYSFYNCGVHTYLRGLMKAGTPKENMKTRLLTISSGSLSFHDMKFYLSPHEQGHSAAATSKKRLPFFEKYVKAHANTIREAGSTPLLIMTWPKKDKPEEITKLADNTIRIANEAKMMTVPVGLAFMEAIKAKPDLEMYMPDKSHPSAAGSYLYGAVLYSTLFHRTPADINYLGECEKPLSPETAKFLREVAWNTVTEFFGWEK